MGRELQCNVKLGKQQGLATAHLDSTGIQLRGSIRGVWLHAQLNAIEVRNDSLTASTPDGLLSIALGNVEAEKWRHALLNPKSRAEKLGLKAKMRVFVIGAHEEISAELSSAECVVSKKIDDAALVFLPVMDSKALNGFDRLPEDADHAQHVWVLREKGRDGVSEKLILDAAAAAGFKPTKTLRWSDTLTADRYSRAAR
jgi:hypothetical protein